MEIRILKRLHRSVATRTLGAELLCAAAGRMGSEVSHAFCWDLRIRGLWEYIHRSGFAVYRKIMFLYEIRMALEKEGQVLYVGTNITVAGHLDCNSYFLRAVL